MLRSRINRWFSLAKVSLKLRDSLTGSEFSADELATSADSPVKQAIDAAGGESPTGTGVLNVVDGAYQTPLGTSTGGNGAVDSGKLVTFRTNGGIKAKASTMLGTDGVFHAQTTATAGHAVVGMAQGTSGRGVFGYASESSGIGVEALATSSGTALAVGGLFQAHHLSITGGGVVECSATTRESFLNALGIPTYADETAANAAESVNIAYWNNATSKVQITTT